MRKVIVLIGIIVGILLLGFRFLFYSTLFLNNAKIMELRSSYYNTLDRVSPKNSLIYGIRTIKVNDDKSFTYSFPGKFQDWDFANSTIILKDLYGRVWKFRYIPNAAYEGYDKLMYAEMLVAKDKSSVSTTKYLIINTKDFGGNKQPFPEGQVLFIFWSDKRNLTEIMKAMKKGEIIEMNGAGLVPVIQVIWE